MDLLLATQNKGKLTEFRDLLANTSLRVLSPADVGLADFEVEETGDTLEINAQLKARAFAQASGLHTLADDTGLLVDALNGEPGVYTARYGGDGLTPAERRQKLLEALRSVSEVQRGARFECVIAVANHTTLDCERVTGICRGRIAFADSGAGGFGYDAIFIPEGYDQTFAELDPQVKHRLSHRGQAVRAVLPVLERIGRSGDRQ
jgi:non-canonical purine NTP pyrophosphatase (RdgB/HAM1 family)